MKVGFLQLMQISLVCIFCFYFTIKLIIGTKGIIEYTKLEEQFKTNKQFLLMVEGENKVLNTKLSLLNEKSINILYLEEMARINLNFGKKNEKFIILEDAN
jgi:cell division protein FtsB